MLGFYLLLLAAWTCAFGEDRCRSLPLEEIYSRYASIGASAGEHPKPLLGEETDRLESLMVDQSACAASLEPSRGECAELRPFGLKRDSLRRRCLLLYRFGAFIRGASSRPGRRLECQRFFEAAQSGVHDVQTISALCGALAAGLKSGKMAFACREFFPSDPSHCLHWFTDSTSDCRVIRDPLSRRECGRNSRIIASFREGRDRCEGDAFCGSLLKRSPGVCQERADAIRAEYCRQKTRLQGFAR